MALRSQREPTMEEIVVALRETRKTADRVQPLPIAPARAGRTVIGSTELADLRDTEIERLLDENARLNARVIALLKVLEQEQASHAQTAAELTPGAGTDREAITHEVRAALEAELTPLLLVLLRLFQQQASEPAADGPPGALESGRSAPAEPAPSEWMVDLMHKLDHKAASPAETRAIDDAIRRRPNLRQCVADVLAALGLEPAVAAARRRIAAVEDPH